MRKSDKIKNFKKVNLLTEHRYLQSKGITGPEIDIDGITDSLVATTLHGGDDNTVYLRAKDSLVDSDEQVKEIEDIYRMLYIQNNNISKGIEAIKENMADTAIRKLILDFVEGSDKGIIRGMI